MKFDAAKKELKQPKEVPLDTKDLHLVRGKNCLKELIRAQKMKEKFQKKIKNSQTSPIELLKAYGALSPLQKDIFRKKLENKNFSSKDLKGESLKSARVQSALADLKHQRVLTATENFKEVKDFESAAKKITTRYNKIKGRRLRDPRQLATAALLWKEAALLCLKQGKKQDAQKLLNEAGSCICFDEADLRLNIKTLFQDAKGASEEVFSVLRGAGHLRHHRLRVSETDIDGTPYLELSFELPSVIRKELDIFLDLVKKNKQITVSKVPAVYLPKLRASTLVGSQGKIIDKDILIRFQSGVKIRIGCNPSYKNQYNFVRIIAKKEISIQEIHQSLASIGLPMALLPPRPKDLQENALQRVLTILHPKKIFQHLPKLSAKKIYATLSNEEKEKVDHYLNKFTLKTFAGHTIEHICPQMGTTVKEEGGKVLASFIFGGNIEKIGTVVGKILTNGLLSAQERFQRGLVFSGYVPSLNFRTGSGNQVFARTMTEANFEASESFNDFPLNGPVLALIDIQAYERIPYFYNEDRGGLRNADFSSPVWYAPRQGPIYNYNGKDALLDRPGLKEFCQGLVTKANFNNETIFNHSLDPHYFRKLIVSSEYDRIQLCDQLERQGIYNINGRSLNKFVVVSKKISEDCLQD